MRALLCSAAIVLLACSQAQAFYDASSPVVTLTPDNFDSKVIEDKENAWIVEFYAPWCGHCKRLTPEWEAAAKQLEKDGVKGVKLAAVDADAHGALGSKYQVQGFPTIKTFGYDKSSPKEYEGGRQKADILHAAKHQASIMEESIKNGKETYVKPPPKERASSGFYDDSEVVELNDDNFEDEVLKKNEPWLIEFYAPWCGHCKQLTPTWKELSNEMAGQVRIAAVDVTANDGIGKKYGIQGFPTLKFFPPGGEPEDYNAGRDLNSLKSFCEGKAEEFPMAPLEVNQIKSTADLNENCLSKTLCVTFVLPHLMDTGVEGRNKYIEGLNAVAKKFSPKKVGFGWVQGGDHYDFEETFGISANYPTYVAIGAKKKLYSKLAGKFETNTIISNIQKLMGPRGAGFYNYKSLPDLESVDLWDGKEYVAPAEDE